MLRLVLIASAIPNRMQDTKKALDYQENADHCLQKEIAKRLKLCNSLSYEEKTKRLFIPYFNLEGSPYLTKKNLAFERWRNYEPVTIETRKYQSPSKHNVGEYKTPLYFPLELIKQYQNDCINNNTIVLTEGEIKAITATKNNINCIAFAGVSLYNHAKEYIKDLGLLTDKIKSKVVNFVILFDSDAINPYTKQGFTNERLLNFNLSAKAFFDVVSSIPTKKELNIFVGYINHEQKGLDDLLQNVNSSERQQIVRELNSPKFAKHYFQLEQVTKRTYKEKINDLFSCYNLQTFLDRYKSILLGQNFSFKHFRTTGGQYSIYYHLDELGTLTSKSDFYRNFDSSFDKTLNYSKYANECLDDVLICLRENKKVLLSAPTGAGKTHLTKGLEAQYKRLILLEPTRATAKQQDGYILNIGGEIVHIDSNVDSFVTTFSKLLNDGRINEQDFAESLLVVDEAHEMYKSYGFRAKECSLIEKLVSSLFKNVLATTATPLMPFFKALNFYCIDLQPQEQKKKPISVQTYNTRASKDGKTDYQAIVNDCISKSRNNGRKAYIYNVSKDNHTIKQVHLNDIDKTLLITSDTSKMLYKDIYNEMLDKRRAFVRDYDVILTNSVLETGASFYDENIDVYILFSSCESEIIQALARFRNVETINYNIILTQQNWQSIDHESPQNDLKEKYLECIKEEYNSETTTANVLLTIDSITKTYQETFSYSRTFFDFENKRITSQPSATILGKLKKHFSIIECSELVAPKCNDNNTASTITIDPTQIFYNGTANSPLISEMIQQLKADKRRTSSISSFSDGYNYYLESSEQNQEQEHRFLINTNCYQMLRLVLYSTDLAIKLGLEVKKVLDVVQTLITHFKQPTNNNRSLIELCLILELLKHKPSLASNIKDRGERILIQNLLKVRNNRKDALIKLSIQELKTNEHLKKYQERQLFRFLKAININLEIREQELKEVTAITEKVKKLLHKKNDKQFENKVFKRIKGTKIKKMKITTFDIAKQMPLKPS